jgi:uroporphyrinogen-III synthase
VTAGRPLAGRRVLVTRPAGRSAELAATLRARGAEVVELPAIAFEAVHSKAVDAAARDAASYALVVFTSPTGVAAFRARVDAPLQAAAAVGPGTARALRAAGIEPAVVAVESRAEGLVDALAAFHVGGRRVLLVRPAAARDVLGRALRARGAAVDAVTFYRTVPAAEAGAAAGLLAAGGVDAVVFASPSALRAVLGALPSEEAGVRLGLERARRVAIGAVTAAAMARRGLPADAQAGATDPAALADAVEAALRVAPRVC